MQGATNFALYASNASAVALCLFTEEDLQQGRTSYEIQLDPVLNKTGDTWHIALPSLDSTLLYGMPTGCSRLNEHTIFKLQLVPGQLSAGCTSASPQAARMDAQLAGTPNALQSGLSSST